MTRRSLAQEAVTRPPTKLWTRGELALYLKVNISTLDRWISAGEIDSVVMNRTRRIPDTAVQDYLARRLQPATENQRKPGRKRSAG